MLLETKRRRKKQKQRPKHVYCVDKSVYPNTKRPASISQKRFAKAPAAKITCEEKGEKLKT